MPKQATPGQVPVYYIVTNPGRRKTVDDCKMHFLCFTILVGSHPAAVRSLVWWWAAYFLTTNEHRENKYNFLDLLSCGDATWALPGDRGAEELRSRATLQDVDRRSKMKEE